VVVDLKASDTAVEATSGTNTRWTSPPRSS
jgi:hypothetical protein